MSAVALNAVDDVLAAAVDAAVGALVADKDIVDIAAVEGGLVEVVRRGKRERLQTLLEGPLFALVRERLGATPQPLAWRLRARATLYALPLVDGRVAVRVQKAAPADARLEHLVEEGVVPAGVDAEFVAAVLEGGGIGFVGPARAAHRRIAVAVTRALAPLVRVAAIGDDTPTGCLPAIAVDGVVARAHAAVLAGADVLVATDLSAKDAVALADAALPVPLIASLGVASMAALEDRFGARKVRALFAVVGVVGFGPDGRPRMIEMHGGATDAAAAAAVSSTPPVTSSTSVPAVASPPPPLPPVPRTAPPPPMPTTSTSPAPLFPDVPPVQNAPPSDWASTHLDDDPGWELGSLADDPPAAGSFDAVLKQAAKRPTFTPRPPPLHPQAAALKGTGGLTFEPPGGALVDDAPEHE